MKRGDRARMSVCAYVCIRVRVILVVEGDLWDRLGLASSGGRGSVCWGHTHSQVLSLSDTCAFPILSSSSV